VVGAAGAGRFFLGVASATIPNTFSERHAVSSRRDIANVATAGASRVPSSRARRIAPLCRGVERDTVLRCRVLPQSSDPHCGRR
jgi:hypothetical protein